MNMLSRRSSKQFAVALYAASGQGEGQVSEHVARRRFREHTSYVKARMASAYDANHLLLGFEIK